MRSVLAMVSVLFISTASAQVTIGPASIERDVYGQKVSAAFVSQISITTDNTGVNLEVTLIGDLSNLQNKFNAIVQTIALPHDNCPGYGTHPLPVIEDASLQSAGTTAVVKIRAKATVWQCVRNPVPSCTISWGQQCIDLGPFGRACTDVPQTRCEEGSPIKTILLEEGFWIDVPLTLATIDQKSLDVVPGSISVQPRGDLGKFVNQIAAIFNSDLNTLAGRELDKLVDQAALRAVLPSEIRAYDLRVQDASFSSENNRLGVRARLTAKISASQLNDFLHKVLNAQSNK